MDHSAVLPSPVDSAFSGDTLYSDLYSAGSPTLVDDDQCSPPPSPTDIDFRDEYEVYVVQYHRVSSPLTAWVIAIRTHTEVFGNVYRLDGCRGSYSFKREEGAYYEASGTWRGSAFICKLSFAELEVVEDVIHQVDIRNDDPNFSHRMWVFDVIQALQANGFALAEGIRTYDDLNKTMGDLLSD
ncbi:hypothetical protein EVJ58_g503 [Rhodofomes roseus]|uniref:Uncharacterized protein n=1 Tax=Rhodofomes roseus TaxID=34475 RepID=A0A4Y9Z5G9_9APHY|nr:hypothetical protein EVJ58_g503 [Rhodofomes roseus]